MPTGLETVFGHVFVTQLGPIPHNPEDGKVVTVHAGREPREIASGARMLIDVEQGPHGKLYGLSDRPPTAVSAGSDPPPASPRLT